jgi:hypothetical protein
LTPVLLRSAGEALWGTQWQRPFSEAFGINPRTLRRFLSGADAIPTSLALEVSDRLQDRQDAAQRLLHKIGR